MALKEVVSLEADKTVSLGKRDKKTGKMGPTEAEGYYLGSRQVKTNRGESNIHFLQTAEGNLGIWGTTDMDRKMKTVAPGEYTVIVSTGTRPTPNGDMYTYSVKHDDENTIDVSGLSSAAASDEVEYASETSLEDTTADELNVAADELEAAAAVAARKAKVQALLNKRK